MNLFQWIVLPLLALIIALELRGLVLRRRSWFLRLLRLGVWISAIVLVAMPHWTHYVANILGIGRGADLVVYVFILVSPLAWFQLQARQHTLQRQLVKLARAEAIRQPIRGAGAGGDGETA